MRIRTLPTALAVSVLALGLTACGGDDEPSDSPTSESSAVETETEEPAETEEPTETETLETETPTEEAAPEDVGPITAPGTELAIGDTATVPNESAGKTGTIAVTVTAIEEGAPDALEGVDGAENLTAYYIRFTVEGVADVDQLQGMQLNLDGLDAQGNPAATVIFGESDECDGESAPSSDWDGTAYETCDVVASENPVVQAVFAEGDDYSLILGEPVVWQ